MKSDKQLAIPLPMRGGKRPRSGRKPKGKKAMVSHAARPRFERATPVHVTLRVAKHVWSLRSRRCFSLLSRSFAEAREHLGMRMIEFSVQGNHLHLIVEANDSRALSRGMQGLCIRIARALNKLMDQAGRVFSDHFHSRLLTTPTELVRTIKYVIDNHEHHFAEGAGPDPFSSTTGENKSLLARPVSWLLRVGRFRYPG